MITNNSLIIHSFIHYSFIHTYIHSFIHSIIHSFIQSIIHSFIQLFIHSTNFISSYKKYNNANNASFE